MSIAWEETDNLFWPWYTKFENQTLKLRANEFPLEDLYTLFADNVEIGNINNWPANWAKTYKPNHLR